MAAVLCFGASITYGVGSASGGWPDYLKRAISARLYAQEGAGEKHEVYNMGIPGETSRQVLLRVENEAAVRRRDMQPEIISLLSAGTNDSRAFLQPDSYVSTPEQYRENLELLIRKSSGYSARVIGIGLTPVDESRTCPKLRPRTGEKSWFTNSRIELFEDIFAALAATLKIDFVPLFRQAGRLDWPAHLYRDGLHPNDKGQAWIAEQVSSVLLPLLRRFE